MAQIFSRGLVGCVYKLRGFSNIHILTLHLILLFPTLQKISVQNRLNEIFCFRTIQIKGNRIEHTVIILFVYYGIVLRHSVFVLLYGWRFDWCVFWFVHQMFLTWHRTQGTRRITWTHHKEFDICLVQYSTLYLQVVKTITWYYWYAF